MLKNIPNALNAINLYLIKPSKYDDDGYVIRYWKGVLPSNTLACLNGLSEDLRRRRVFGEKVKLIVHNIDETVQRVDLPKMIRSSYKKQSKTIACLVGVQTNQFPRAADIALALRKAGIDVLIGGFHVSGVIAMFPELSPELVELRNAGVTLVAGEVEGQWEIVLKDAVAGRLKPIYNYLKNPPDLQSAPIPALPENLLRAYVIHRFATLDCGRGCPFACSFCTVINVQGRVMRFRRVECILEMIRKNYLQHKIDFYFFTDDNFSRNKNWRAIFEGLIRLRHEENIKVTFMMQVDTQSHRIPEFISLAAEAGCSQVFIGVESMNEKNLEAVSKKQNKVEEFQSMIMQYSEKEIAAHLSYIIGFPYDSTESVADDVRRLQEFIAPQASFFMLTPLPGSMDHKTAHSRRMLLDADLNNFDSFHATFRHDRMPGLSWKKAYDDAWKSFYGVPNMIRILKRVPSKEYWHIFMNFIWYKNAVQVEQGHPMTHGFFRLKNRQERRRIFPLENRRDFFMRRINDLSGILRGWVRLAFEMEEVWLATRLRSPLEKYVVAELAGCHKRLDEWWKLRPYQLQRFYRKALRDLELMDHKPYLSKVKVPSSFELWIKRWDYDIWIYSDHGQEDAILYTLEHGRSIEDAIAKIFGELPSVKISKSKMRFSHEQQIEHASSKVIAVGMGPLVHIYPSVELSPEEKNRVVSELLMTAKIPVVMIPNETGQVEAQTETGKFMLPRDAGEILGKDHPFLQEAASDLVALCHHPSAGKIIISGYCQGKRLMTFAAENGCHAGYGPEETRGFALLPPDAPVSLRERTYLRPLDIRDAAFQHLGRTSGVLSEPLAPFARTLRILTYNVHGCVGLDGKNSPDRIARVIARQNADVVALQEIDVGRNRSGKIDQAEKIANKLEMAFHFHSTISFEDGKYGNAILSRYPLKMIQMHALPQLKNHKLFEPRGALWVEIDVNGIKVNVITTHLSLWPAERLLQAEALLGSDWTGSVACREPVILCGDFNATPRSIVCKRMGCKLRDAQLILASHKPKSTWRASHPFSRIDHIFVSQNIDVDQVEVPSGRLEKLASDHLPLIANLQIGPTVPKV